MMKSLIINADDFGLSPGTNAAIIECHKVGSVSSATMMVNMPAVEIAVVLAKQNPALGVGLHFNLTSGRPVSSKGEVSSLVGRDDHFFSRSEAEKKAISGQFNGEEVRRELESQLARFRSFGLTPTHLDSHQHIHLYPMVFDVVASLCIEQNLPLRLPWAWKPPTVVPLRRRIRMWMLNRMVTRNMKRWGGKLRVNASFASIFDFQLNPEDISLESYLKILQYDHASAFELMVHPAVVDQGHEQATRISHVSSIEYDVLKSSDLGALALDLGYGLTDYSMCELLKKNV